VRRLEQIGAGAAHGHASADHLGALDVKVSEVVSDELERALV
jgi:hypothetical protein